VKQADLMHKDLDSVIAKYLLVYRVTKHGTTGESPSMLLMGRNLRTRMDLIRPSVRSHVEIQQQKMVEKSASRGCRKLYCGDRVQARNFGNGPKWMPGVVVEIRGSRHYLIDVQGKLWKRHIDQLLSSQIEAEGEISTSNNTSHVSSRSVPNIVPVSPNVPVPPNVPKVPVPPNVPKAPCVPNTSANAGLPSADNGLPKAVVPQNRNNVPPDKTPNAAPEKRYPSRETRREPSYLKDYSLK
jgi:hypothetical protein